MSKVNVETLSGRMRYFAKVRYKNLRRLSEVAGVNYHQLAQYTDEEPPGGLTLVKLIDAGLNSTWLLKKLGPMDVPGKDETIYDPDDKLKVVVDPAKIAEMVSEGLQEAVRKQIEESLKNLGMQQGTGSR